MKYAGSRVAEDEDDGEVGVLEPAPALPGAPREHQGLVPVAVPSTSAGTSRASDSTTAKRAIPALLRSAASDIVLMITRPAATRARCRSRYRSTAAAEDQARASVVPGWALEEHVERHRRPAHERRRNQPGDLAGGAGRGDRPGVISVLTGAHCR